MKSLAPFFSELIASDPAPEKIPGKRGRPAIAEKAMTRTERNRKSKSQKSMARRRCIAVLDMETDPFDKVTQERIFPFVACFYSKEFETCVIWEENENVFVSRVVDFIERLPEQFTIYAHNGGKFDFMFLVHRLRGKVSFKGRGIMSARIGNHQLRDSFHIIPEKLANYHKKAFDYEKMRKEVRSAHRDEIIAYLISDCVYLFDIVEKFVQDFGLKLSIGQAAMAELKKSYDVPKFSENWDAYMRDYFFGGRVECLKGAGHFRGNYKLYDVNSMYPHVMASYRHPVGNMFDYKIRRGVPGNATCFVHLRCRNNGALIARADSGETTARIPVGEFFTTIWEYEVACKYNLISEVEIIQVLDCEKRTTFADFVLPLYTKRQDTKAELARLKTAGMADGAKFLDVKKDDIFYKLLLNNAYGKFAQNPRSFKEHYLTDVDELPPGEWFASINELPETERGAYFLPRYECDQYWIWEKPAPAFTFNNVGVAASITGAARAILLEAMQHAKNPIYCDTDSIICESLSGMHLDGQALGAWDIEDEFKSVVIAGKKLYSVEHAKPRKLNADQLKAGMSPNYTIKSKGTAGLLWSDMLDLVNGGEKTLVNFGPTLTKTGSQNYISRKIRATAKGHTDAGFISGI